jgi:hypothetical protein
MQIDEVHEINDNKVPPVNNEVLVDWKNTESPAGFILYISTNQ